MSTGEATYGHWTGLLGNLAAFGVWTFLWVWGFNASSSGAFSVASIAAVIFGAYALLWHRAYWWCLHDDGRLEFRSVLRRRFTAAADVRRIRCWRSNPPNVTVAFRHGRVQLSVASGRALSKAVMGLNPAVEVEGFRSA
jgi:hypothetical protein